MFEINLPEEKEIILNVNGQNVKFIEYKYTPEGDFFKIYANIHALGVNAEYELCQNKYNYENIVQQEYKKIKFNGKESEFDILTIVLKDSSIKKIYFDISQMMKNKYNITLNEDKSKIIYDKLINEYNFSIDCYDEESLIKKINETISISFDVNYFFGLILENSKLDKGYREKYEKIMDNYISDGFIGNIINFDELIGGFIQIDNLYDINVVFENYRNLEEKCKNIK